MMVRQQYYILYIYIYYIIYYIYIYIYTSDVGVIIGLCGHKIIKNENFGWKLK